MHEQIELEVDPKALSVVDCWLGIRNGGELEDDDLPTQRPHRLGLGAKFISQVEFERNQSDRIEKKLKRSIKRPESDLDDNSGVEDDHKDESVYVHTGSKKKVIGDSLALLGQATKHKKKKKKSQNQVQHATAALPCTTSSSYSTENVIIRQNIEQKEKTEETEEAEEANVTVDSDEWKKPSATTLKLNDEYFSRAIAHFREGGARTNRKIAETHTNTSQRKDGQCKKPKKRSRLKNIRADNRSIHEKPAHLRGMNT